MKLFKLKKLMYLIVACSLFGLCHTCAASTGENTDNIYTEQNNNINNNKIEADCVFSVGEACRPAHYLRKYKLRFQASPLDWMMEYSPETAIHLFKTKFVDFFEEIEEVPGKYCCENKVVKDVKNKITSIHHFRKDAPLDDEHKQFRAMMLERAAKVDEFLKKSSSIALICNRTKSTTLDLINFIKSFSEIYPGKKITLINVVDADIAEFCESTLFENNNLKIIQFVFSDTLPAKSSEQSPAWQGNPEAWGKIASRIKINEKILKM